MWNFAIREAAGTEVAHITQDVGRPGQTLLTTADNYVLEILRPLDDPLRSLVVAAALAVDTALKQDGRGLNMGDVADLFQHSPCQGGVVETERLRLRRWTDDDLDPLAAIFADAEVWRYPFGRGFTREETARFLDRQVRHWEEHGFGMWAAELKDDGRLVGYLGLAVPTWLPEVLPAVEVGWRLGPDHWGRGLATEGGAASLRHGFEQLDLDRVISIFMPANVASGRVMAKLGMVEMLRTTDPERGVPLEVRAITRASWRGLQLGP